MNKKRSKRMINDNEYAFDFPRPEGQRTRNLRRTRFIRGGFIVHEKKK